QRKRTRSHSRRDGGPCVWWITAKPSKPVQSRTTSAASIPVCPATDRHQIVREFHCLETEVIILEPGESVNRGYFERTASASSAGATAQCNSSHVGAVAVDVNRVGVCGGRIVVPEDPPSIQIAV